MIPADVTLASHGWLWLAFGIGPFLGVVAAWAGRTLKIRAQARRAQREGTSGD